MGVNGVEWGVMAMVSCCTAAQDLNLNGAGLD
jgi:hypothetical protein